MNTSVNWISVSYIMYQIPLPVRTYIFKFFDFVVFLFEPDTIYWTREVTYLCMCVCVALVLELIVYIFIVLFFNRRWHIFYLYFVFIRTHMLCKGGGLIGRADRIQIIRWSSSAHTHTHTHTHTHINTYTHYTVSIHHTNPYT